MERNNIVYHHVFGFGIILKDDLIVAEVLFKNDFKKRTISKDHLTNINYGFVEYCINGEFGRRFYNDTVKKGEVYYKNRNVKSIFVTKDEITAIVNGNESYTTKINVAYPYPGTCTCPVSARCKHMYALFLTLKYIFISLINAKQTTIYSDTLPEEISSYLERLMRSPNSKEDYYQMVNMLKKYDDEVFIEFFKQVTYFADNTYSNVPHIVAKYALMDDRIRECLNRNIDSFIDNRFYAYLSTYLEEANRFIRGMEFSVEDCYAYFYYIMHNNYQDAFPYLLSKTRRENPDLSDIDKDVLNKVEINEKTLNSYVDCLLEDISVIDKTKLFYERLSDDQKKELLKTDGLIFDVDRLEFMPVEDRMEFYHQLDFDDHHNVDEVIKNIVIKDDNYLEVAEILEDIAYVNDRMGIGDKLANIAQMLPKSQYLEYYLRRSIHSRFSYYRDHSIEFKINARDNAEDAEAFYLYFKDVVRVKSVDDEDEDNYFDEYDIDDEYFDYRNEDEDTITYYLHSLSGNTLLKVKNIKNYYYQYANRVDGEELCKYTKYFTYSAIERNKEEVQEILKLNEQKRIEREAKRKKEAMLKRIKELGISYKGKKINLGANNKAHLEYHFSDIRGNEKYLELKVGIDKMYVVKSIYDFARSFRTNETISYGKNLVLTHNINNFIDEDKEVLTTLLMIIESSDSYGRRGIKLNQYLMDKLMMLLKGRKVFFGDKEYLLTMNEIKLENKIDENYCLHLNIPIENRHFTDLGSKLLVFDEKKRTVDYCNVNHEEKELYRFFIENDGMCIEDIKEEFNDQVYSNYPGSIEIADEIKKDFKLADVQLKAYFDYKDKCIEVKTHYYLNDVEVTKDKIKKQRDLNKINNYEEYLSSIGFDNEGIMSDDKDVLAFFYMDFTDLKKYAEVFLSDSIKNKKVYGFSPSTINVSYNNNLMEAFLEDSKYSDEELEAILRSIKRKKNYVLLSDDRIIDLSGKEASDFYDTVTDLKLDPKHLNEVREISIIDSLKALAHENNVKIDDYIHKMINDIANFKSAKYKEPKLNGELRKYQKEGFKWLKTLSDYHIGGILADDMGLGKTIEIIALIKSSNVKKPSLIVCPKSLIFNWINEFARFAPEIKVKEIYGLKSERKEIIEKINPKEKVIYITAYDSLRNDVDEYKVNFEYLVIDEAQYIKNVNAQKTLTVKKIKADHYFALTGTPIENNIIDLWSIFDFMLPGYLEDLNTYKSKYSDEDLQEVLAKRVSPFILRRTKQNVLKDLPSKFERIVTAEMNDKQRKIYDAEKLVAKSKLEDGGKAFDVLPYLMRLRQICVDPSTYIDNYHGGSGKMEQLMEIVDEYLKDGHRLLIFSQFVKALNLVEEELKKRKIPYFIITGETDAKKRLAIADAFNNGSKEAVCLVSLKAGGTGLNLIGADTVIHLDPWWNVAAENQASDRSHRIGQTKTVEVIKLICANSIEQRVIELQNIKKDLIDKLISNDDSSITKATIEDIKFMLD